jgi:hypothetical protein
VFADEDQVVARARARVILEVSASGIVNAASYLGRAISTGEIITIPCSFRGPDALVTLQFHSHGYVATR